MEKEKTFTSGGITDDYAIKKQGNCGGIGYSQSGALGFNNLVRQIIQNNDIYTFLIYFYLDEISDQHFEQEMKIAAEKGINEREYLSRYFAARIPGEDCYEKLIGKIKEIAAEP